MDHAEGVSLSQFLGEWGCVSQISFHYHQFLISLLLCIILTTIPLLQFDHLFLYFVGRCRSYNPRFVSGDHVVVFDVLIFVLDNDWCNVSIRLSNISCLICRVLHSSRHMRFWFYSGLRFIIRLSF